MTALISQPATDSSTRIIYLLLNITMRFATLSLLLALGIGYVSGIEKPYKQACGIDGE